MLRARVKKNYYICLLDTRNHIGACWRKEVRARRLQVTGGNKGIGVAIVQGLCRRFDGDVFLRARDVARGEAAVEQLRQVLCNELFDTN